MSEKPDLQAEEVLTPREAARRMKAHVSTIYRWLQSGRLPAWRKGGRLIFRADDLAALLTPVEPRRKAAPAGAAPEAAGRREAARRTREILREEGMPGYG